MKPSTDLHTLIHSLTTSEKGYIRKMAAVTSGKKNSGYMRLYDLVEQQPVYDEQAILKQYKNEKVAKQLPVIKNYLFKLILKLLRNYKDANSDESILSNRILNSDLLFEKGMYSSSFSELEYAADLSIHLDAPLKLLEVKSKERALHLEIAAKNWKEAIGKNIDETKQILTDYTNYIELFSVYYQLMHFWRHHRIIRNPDEQKMLDDLMRHPLMKSNRKHKGFYTHLVFLSNHLAYHFVSGNDDLALKYQQQILAHWDAHSHFKVNEPLKYLAAVNNFVNVCYRANRLDLVKSGIERFNEVSCAGKESIEAVAFENKNAARLAYLFATLKFDNAEQILDEMKAGFTKYKGKINPVRELMLKFNTVILYWVQNKMPEAIDVANEILNEKDIELRKDMQAALRMIYLILHFELNNTFMLEYAIRSAKRYLKLNDKLYETERMFFRYLLKLNSKGSNKERFAVYCKMHAELTNILENHPLERNLQQTFDLNNWLNPKIQGISLKEYLLQQGTL